MYDSLDDKKEEPNSLFNTEDPTSYQPSHFDNQTTVNNPLDKQPPNKQAKIQQQNAITTDLLQSHHSIVPIKLEQQKLLKKVFGVCQVYNPNGQQPEDYINSVVHYLTKYHEAPYNDILNVFFIYLNEEFHKCFFALKDDQKINLEIFKKGFLSEAYRIRIETSNLAFSKQTEFINQLNKLYSKDKIVLSSINSYPTYNYFKYKWIYLAKVLKSISRSDLLEMSIYLLSESDLKIKLLGLRNQEPRDFLIYVKHIDLVNKE